MPRRAIRTTGPARTCCDRWMPRVRGTRCCSLACFATHARVISSPALRCTESVRPYAARFGGRVEAMTVLDVPGRDADLLLARTDQAGPLRHLFRDLVAAGRPVV